MNEKGASISPAVNKAVRVESIPFSSLPGQSRLFLDFLEYPASLRRFYPNAVSNTDELKRHVPDVLANYRTDRQDLCSVLLEMNNGFGCSEATRSNIEKLARAETVAVVTGQQAGLFTGPLYTLYKAITALKISERLNALGVSAVPVFWVATEDHDFEEISRAFAVGRDGELFDAELKGPEDTIGRPVGDIPLCPEIDETVQAFLEKLPASEFTPALDQILADAWTVGQTIGSAFARTLARLLSDRGLILLDPNLESMKRLAAPIYVDAVKHAPEIVDRIVKRGERLTESGYHAQVLVEDDYFPLFWITDTGVRSSIRKTGNGVYRSKEDKREFTLDDLAAIARGEPSRLSPGVMLRSVVQDYILPTVAYVGGGAEIAYFAQNSETYGVLKRPVTPIIHRQSFTVIGSRHARTLAAFGVEFADLFEGYRSLVTQAVDNTSAAGPAGLFGDVEEKINAELNRLDQALSEFDASLADSLAKRRKKIIYHIAELRKKAYLSQIRRDETTDRRLRSMLAALVPNGGLQERTLNFAGFFNKYGPNFIEWIYDATDVDERGHRLIYL